MVANDDAKDKSKTSGTLIQYVNHLFHQEPTSSLFSGIFWGLMLMLVCPLVGTYLFSQTLYRCFKFIGSLLRSGKESVINAKEDSRELAVYITGCDSGFGRSLSFLLAERGFIVFSGCLTEDGMKQFNGNPSIYPLKVDVTKESDVDDASIAVMKWLKDPVFTKPRCLHAVINNAGVGTGGLIDWNPLSNYKFVMNVNYFGTIRTTKSFLPILKEQASSGSYGAARIINVVSMAGLTTLAGSSTYFSSKHATEAFSSCLRTEMMAFNIPVVTINPSFHVTDMTENMGLRYMKLWEQVSPEIKADYGDEYFMQMYKNSTEKVIQLGWNASVVEDQLVESVESINPNPQIIVGSDARYFMLLLRMLPTSFRDKVKGILQQNKIPAKMKKLSK